MTTQEQLIAEYRAQNPRSYELFQRAQTSLPGGNTRTGVYVVPMMNRGIATRVGGAPSLPMTAEHAQQFIDESKNALKEWPF